MKNDNPFLLLANNNRITINDYEAIDSIPEFLFKQLNIKHLIIINQLTKDYLLSIKLYYVFGYEKTMNILKGKYGPINNDLLNLMLKNIDLNNIIIDDKGINYNHHLIDILLGNGHNSSNLRNYLEKK